MWHEHNLAHSEHLLHTGMTLLDDWELLYKFLGIQDLNQNYFTQGILQLITQFFYLPSLEYKFVQVLADEKTPTAYPTRAWKHWIFKDARH